VFVIGGATIYEQALPEIDKLYLTLVDSDKEGDAFFPEYKNEFKEVDAEKKSTKGVIFEFKNLERK